MGTGLLRRHGIAELVAASDKAAARGSVRLVYEQEEGEGAPDLWARAISGRRENTRAGQRLAELGQRLAGPCDAAHGSEAAATGRPTNRPSAQAGRRDRAMA